VFADDHALATRDILERVNADDELPFGGWHDGNGFDSRAMARLLRAFGIKPRVVRVGEGTARGYLREQFEDAWERYLDDHGARTPAPGVTSVTSVTSRSQSAIFVTDDPQQTRNGDVTDPPHVRKRNKKPRFPSGM
jgi:hypothetical protein